MRRCNSPFNGNRYVLNKNTGEIHDLDRETSCCRINDIKSEHIFMRKLLFFLPCLTSEETDVLTACQRKTTDNH